MEQLLLRVDEAARVLGLGRTKVYELVSSGDLPSITIGTSRRIAAEDLRRWVAARSATGGWGGDAPSPMGSDLDAHFAQPPHGDEWPTR